MKHTLDACGKACPMPIVLIFKGMNKLALNDTLVVTADDLAFGADVRAWCRKTGNELVSINQLEDGITRVTIRKSAIR